MNVYMDITLLSCADIGHNFLLEKVYRQIHLGLVEWQNADGLSAIGLAFPEYNAEKHQLGSKLRLFYPDRKTFEDFNAQKWLSRLTDYIHLTNIRDVPDNMTNYKRYKRQQSKSSKERIARRRAKRSGIEFEEALKQLYSCKATFLKAPFINVSSVSSGHNFRLFVIEESCRELINEGFSCYGLSTKSSLPDF